jgi:hypothetical protein
MLTGVKAYLHDDIYPLILWVFNLLDQLNDVSVLEPFKNVATLVSYSVD